MPRIQVGDREPDVTMTSSDGRRIVLSDFIGKSAVVLFFYPRDNTSVCTKEACSFRDAYEDFVAAGAVVIGVSADSDESHRQFAASQRLPFLLVSDADGALRRAFGVAKPLGLIPGRVTYVIDREGVVRHVYSALFQGVQHRDEALRIVRELQSNTA